MRITLALPSRGRPAGLLSVLTTLDALATGNNEITYAVIVDSDDEPTRKVLCENALPAGVRVISGARSKTVNARVNEAMREHPAEIYSQVVDDCFPLTQHWDAILVAARQLPAFCWLEMNDPENATFLVISEKWKKATGRFYPDYFPFWFADTWLAEVHKLAFGEPISVINQLAMGGKRGTTQGMRELSFWFKFFAATRPERVEEAKKICEAFGVRWLERPGLIEEFEKADAYQLTQIPRYEAVFKANQGEPTQVYRDAKERALKWLHDHTGLLACAE
jgi:hypothetical protein